MTVARGQIHQPDSGLTVEVTGGRRSTARFHINSYVTHSVNLYINIHVTSINTSQ